MSSFAARILAFVLAGATAWLAAVPPAARAQAAAPTEPPSASPAASQPAAIASTGIAIVGPDGRSTSFTAAMLASLPVARVSASAHDKKVAYAGADLFDVLRAAGIEPPDHLRGTAMRRILLAQGADGYTAAFSFAELDPSLGGRKVYLVDRADGEPLREDGPWRLVVPQDARAGRWVRQLVRLTVVDP
jgi:hypothetical protein